MIEINDLTTLIMPHAPSAPEPIVEDAIRATAEDICRRARVWRYEDDFTMSLGEDCLSAPHCAHILSIESASIEGRPLRSITPRQLELDYPKWRDDKGSPEVFWQEGLNTIRLTPAPAEPCKVFLSLILTTTVDAELLPDLFHHAYRQLLTNGVAFRLLMMPAQAWTDQNSAVVPGQLFESGLITAAIEAQRGQQNARFRARSNFF